MKTTNLKLFLSLAIIVGIASIDSIAATNNIECNPIGIGPTIEAVNIINAKSLNPPAIGVKNIDIQRSLPIIL
ncbi:MAG TPA: hypothetical protein VJT15_13425 [Pyrinomonadaceae bacterium]|nr:hypothetical protein [Pyrinomonadaceae bacterium]